MSKNVLDEIIKQKIDESIVSAFEVLRKRIDKFGVIKCEWEVDFEKRI